MKFEFEANLSQKSINNLIKNIKNYKTKLNNARQDILEALSEYTQERARYRLKKSLIHPELSTGKLSDSIGIKYISDTHSKVYTDLNYAAYVEFGTGARGSDTHEYSDSIDYNKDYLSGQKAHRYMYNAVLDLENNYKIIAKRVLKKGGLIE